MGIYRDNKRGSMQDGNELDRDEVRWFGWLKEEKKRNALGLLGDENNGG